MHLVYLMSCLFGTLDYDKMPSKHLTWLSPPAMHGGIHNLGFRTYSKVSWLFLVPCAYEVFHNFSILLLLVLVAFFFLSKQPKWPLNFRSISTLDNFEASTTLAIPSNLTVKLDRIKPCARHMASFKHILVIVSWKYCFVYTVFYFGENYWRERRFCCNMSKISLHEFMRHTHGSIPSSLTAKLDRMVSGTRSVVGWPKWH